MTRVPGAAQLAQVGSSPCETEQLLEVLSFLGLVKHSTNYGLFGESQMP